MFAYAVQISKEAGFDGVLIFKAKTSELLEYYRREFGARQVGADDPFRLVLWEDAAAANHGSHMHKNEVTPQMASFFLFPFQRPQRRLQRPQPPKRRKNGMFSSLRSHLPAARAVWGFVRGR